MGSNIHPTAIISPGAQIGADVTIGAYSVIGPKVTLADRVRVGPHVVIEGRTTVGEETELFQFCALGATPQDLKFRGEDSELILGKRNKVREFVTMHIGTETGGMATRIGDNNLFMANCHVAHDCQIENNCVFANSVALAGHVRVGNNAILGGLAGIHQFCRVGTYAMISAGSMVGADFPPYCMGQGDRCFVRGLNIVGLKRAGMSREDVSSIKEAYWHFYSSPGHYVEKADQASQKLLENGRSLVFVNFIKNIGKRGLCRPLRGADPNVDTDATE